MAVVKIPAQLRIVTDDEGEIEVDGATDRGRARGGVRPPRGPSGANHRERRPAPVRRERLRRRRGHPFKDGLETEISDGDEVQILPAVAGG